MLMLVPEPCIQVLVTLYLQSGFSWQKRQDNSSHLGTSGYSIALIHFFPSTLEITSRVANDVNGIAIEC